MEHVFINVETKRLDKDFKVCRIYGSVTFTLFIIRVVVLSTSWFIV